MTTGRQRRRKGHAWERELVRRFEAIGIGARRNLRETRDGSSGDLVLPGLPLLVEAKRGVSPNMLGAIRQASKAAEPDALYPVAMVHKDGRNQNAPSEEYAVLRLDDFLEIVKLLREFGIW